MPPSRASTALHHRTASVMLLLGAGVWGGWAIEAGGLRYASTWTAWNLAGALALVAASFAIRRRSVASQVFALGAALWAILRAFPPGPASMCTAALVQAGILAFGAVMLAGPWLKSDAARAEFAPVAHRPTFLAGALGATVVGLDALHGGLWQAISALHGQPTGDPGAVWGPLLLGAGYVASAIGVARMRAWGVLLGVATALGCVVCALPMWRLVNPFELACVCLPGAVLASPLLRSWLASREDTRRRIEPAPATGLRFATEGGELTDELPAADEEANAATLTSRVS